MIANILKNFNVFADGESMAGRVSEAITPKIVQISEEYRAGGMDSPIDIDMGLEKPVLGVTFSEITPSILALFSSMTPKAFQLRGAAEGDNGVVPIVIDCRGRITEIDPGSWTVGAKADTSYTISLVYFKYTIAGKTDIEIDIEGFKRIIGGVDQLFAQRLALGI